MQRDPSIYVVQHHSQSHSVFYVKVFAFQWHNLMEN